MTAVAATGTTGTTVVTIDMRPRLARAARLRRDRARGGWLLVMPGGGVRLSEGAAEIVRRCDGSRSLGQIACELAAENPEARHSLVGEVLSLVRALAAGGALG